MQKKRVTQKDVAYEAGVHRATVSLAVRNHPSIPAETRERVMRAARKLGYAPDPMLSALAMYRSTMKDHTFQGTLAWLAFTDKRFPWNKEGLFWNYYQGALSRAKEHGFKLERFEFDPHEIKAERQASILRARNIRGILLAPQTEPRKVVDFIWDDFSFITFGYSLLKPELHTVCTTQYRAMAQIMSTLHERGYRRISLAINMEHNERTDNNYLSGYLTAQYRIGEPPLVHDEIWSDTDAFIKRLREEKPEAVVIGSPKVLTLMRENGFRIPRDCAVVCPGLSSDESKIAGVVEDAYHIGEVAVDHLTRMIMRGERGIPQKVQRVHIEGIWKDGPTIAPAKKRTRRKTTSPAPLR
ncbi:LacI family DNA-binding transcriptional regulator [Ruficoccus sp. ZRK36]|uniref:LacI family DNA-binding transcriptional regulator n=1 Tax=Ruficoccus sp. ZRK36 TaxID=2866311 RepID=UPI001C7364A3|nr:LacI family DNA-binding transcriptional regulator [Ruficoccus sp. ZRK36]QYY36046.1 LacI family transcriptional regulator [Ruficoccus sp. ZRK36]